MAWPAKDPNEILDYSWTVALDAGDSITAHTATIVSGTATIQSSSAASGKVTAFITGGVDGQSVVIEMRATTAGGRVFEHSGQISIISSANAFEVAFKAAYPAFADTPREAIAYWHDRALRVVDARFGDDQSHAAMLLTAHYLTIQGQGESAEAQRHAKFGGATSIKSGTLSINWDSSAGQAPKSRFEATRYGLEFLPLLRSYCGGPRITATGIAPLNYRAYPHGFA
jgi:hypothetical protein